MSDASSISYQEYIPTDTWSLQGWYISKMSRLERLFARLMKAWYNGSEDRQALILFYSELRSYYLFASENFVKHLPDAQLRRFVFLVHESPAVISTVKAEELTVLLNVFHWKSGLSKLSSSRPLGEFAYARQKLGLDPKDAGV